MYQMDAVYVHDAAALAAVICPSLFEWHDGKVVVVADGPAKGRTVLDECEWPAGVPTIAHIAHSKCALLGGVLLKLGSRARSELVFIVCVTYVATPIL